MRNSAPLRCTTDEKEKRKRAGEVEKSLVHRINHERGAKLVPKTPRPGWREGERWASRLGAPWGVEEEVACTMSLAPVVPSFDFDE